MENPKIALLSSRGDELLHAGAGSTLLLGQAFVLVPGLLPSLALASVIAAVALVPLAAAALAAAVVLAPPYGLWRIAVGVRRRRRPPPSPPTRGVNEMHALATGPRPTRRGAVDVDV